jgi:hypothetical protein
MKFIHIVKGLHIIRTCGISVCALHNFGLMINDHFAAVRISDFTNALQGFGRICMVHHRINRVDCNILEN